MCIESNLVTIGSRNPHNGQEQFSDDHVSTLEEPKPMLEDVQMKTSSLPHPIQDCPEDILRIIFDYTTRLDGNERGSFRTATTISHVCKYWRDVILRMSSLWTSVSISMKDSIEDTALFVKRTRSRLGNTPADIVISNIGELSIDLMKKMMESVELHKFQAISNLNYYIKTSDDLAHLTTLTQLSTCTTVNHMGIIQDHLSGQSPKWDGTCILVHFPSLTSLLLDVVADVTFSNSETYTTLRNLEIRGRRLGIPSFSLQILQFPELRELLISDTVLKSQESMSDIIIPHLRRLSVSIVQNFPWSKVSAPRLEQVDTSHGQNNDVIEFLCRHPSISSLMWSIKSRGESFNRLARCLVNLEFLGLDDTPRGLYEEIDSTAPFPPFPKLKELITDNRRDQLSLSEFEALVHERFLSQRSPNVATLTNWQIFVKGNELEGLPWYRSTLMDQLQMKEEKMDERSNVWCLTLTLK